MFGMGWSEMVLIGIVALIVVGPQELPGLFRTVGQYVGKAKGMAREFSRAMDQAADETGMKDINKTIRAAANPKQFGMDAVKSYTAPKPEQLSPEREAARAKIEAATAKAGQERLAAMEQSAAELAADADFEEPAPLAKPEAKSGTGE